MKIRQFGKYPHQNFTPPISTAKGTTTFIQHPKEMPLTGIVQNQQAREGEERLARTFNKGIAKGMVRGYKFRYSPGVPKGVAGWKELDFLLHTVWGYKAISVKGEDFVHKTIAAKENDRLSEVIILSRLAGMGIHLPGVITIATSQLKTQDAADKVGRDLGAFR